MLHSASSAQAGLGAESAVLAPPADLGDIRFDEVELLKAVHESGVGDEFPGLEVEDLLRLASMSMIICSLASSADSMAQFEQGLGELELPEDTEELAFMFGFSEHVRGDLLASFEDSKEANVLRLIMRGRLARARSVADGGPTAANPASAASAALNDVVYRLSAYFQEAFGDLGADETRTVMAFQDEAGRALQELTDAEHAARNKPAGPATSDALNAAVQAADAVAASLDARLADLVAGLRREG